MRTIIVSNNPTSLPLSVPGIKVVSAKEYLTSSSYSSIRGLTVFNLCKSYSHRTDGYYVSLIAVARGHHIFPRVKTIQESKSRPVVKIFTDNMYALLQKSLKQCAHDRFSFDIYFGRPAVSAGISETEAPSAADLCDLARKISCQFPAPLIRAGFVRKKGEWLVHCIRLLTYNEIPESQIPFAVNAARLNISGGLTLRRRTSQSLYRLAILVDKNEEVPPSDKKAISKFMRAAEKVGFNAELITREDYDRIPEFDALFIRETTNVNHHTFRFASRAEAEGLAVIDDPLSILRCTNKVYLAELLRRHRIPAPQSVIISHGNMDNAIKVLGYPTILKEPDGAFSQGVLKVVNREDFIRKAEKLLEHSDLIIAQEFMPTSYDWRIGVIDNRVVYACRYYMAKSHWQIVNWKCKGKGRVGKWDCVPLSEVPPVVLRTALRAANAIGSSLYGVDLKLVGDRCYVIEVNDNPSIETGVEDIILGDELYSRIIGVLYERVRSRREGKLRLTFPEMPKRKSS